MCNLDTNISNHQRKNNESQPTSSRWMNMRGLFQELNGRFIVNAQCAQANTLVVDLGLDCNNARKENTMRTCHETKGWMKKMKLMQRLSTHN